MDSVWWSRVPNARSLISTITQHLLDENSVLLQYNNPLPWKNTFISEIEASVRAENSSKSFAFISGSNSPGKYLLEEYCKAEKRAEYRPAKGYAKFFAESDDIILHEYYFWIAVKSDADLLEWSNFISEYIKYRSKGKSKAAFVLDCHGITVNSKHKGLKVINSEKVINEYDKRVFATLITAGIKESLFIKTYLTELIVNIAGNDVELMATLIGDYDDVLNNPYEGLSKACADAVHSDGTMFDISKDAASVEHDVWKTQIRTIYPHIEEFRQTFVERHFDEIKEALPVEAKDGEWLYEPNDLELGTLVYLTSLKKLSLRTDEFESLQLFKDARNILSHLGVLSFHRVTSLI